jgi:hypothetical protein
VPGHSLLDQPSAHCFNERATPSFSLHLLFWCCADRLVRACSELPKLCEFFHIPFQSGDDDILRQMKRGYTAARYTSIIDNIRRYMPDASISGDAIVGFPGEGAQYEMIMLGDAHCGRIQSGGNKGADMQPSPNVLVTNGALLLPHISLMNPF